MSRQVLLPLLFAVAVAGVAMGTLVDIALPPKTTPPQASYYGNSVSSSGNVIAVGVPGGIAVLDGDTGHPYHGPGHVELFTLTAGVATHQFTLTVPTTSVTEYAMFGYSVALTNNGQYLVVGSPFWGYEYRANNWESPT